MIKKTTGKPALDYILKGGFPENSTQLIIGPPGVGKTILAESILNRISSPEERGLFITTTAEPLSKLIRFAQGFEFFKPDSVGEYIFYEQVGDLLRSEGLVSAIDRIITHVKEYAPTYVVIDSFKAFHSFGATEQEVSRALTKLSFHLSAIAITAFLVGEYSFDEASELPEFVMADGITELSVKRFGVKTRRFLRVIKMRGSDYMGGEHTFDIDDRGVNIYPRLIAPLATEYPVEKGKVSTGIEGFDRMVGGGFKRGSTTCVFGPPGAGKTISALHFLFKAIAAGEKGLYITLTENPVQLADNASSLGFGVREAISAEILKVRYYAPDAVYIDKVSQDIANAIEKDGVKRVVIDSMNDLESSVPLPEAFSDYVYALAQRMVINQVSLWLTAQVEPLFSISSLTQLGASHMIDNIILINFEKAERDIKRYVTVLKTRGQEHVKESRPMEITSKGIRVW